MAFVPVEASAEAKKKTTHYRELLGKAKCSADRALCFRSLPRNHFCLFFSEARNDTLNGISCL